MTRPSLPLKLYYRIGEVADIVGVEPHVLRYWESEFPTIRPQKSPKGQRVYSRRDLEKLIRVKELLYSEGYTVQGARKRLRELAKGELAKGELAKNPEPKANVEVRSRFDEPPRSLLEPAIPSSKNPLESFPRNVQVRTALEALRRSIADELAALPSS